MAFVVAVASYYLIHSEVIKNQEEVLKRDNELLAQRLDRFFAETEQTVLQVSQSDQVKKYLQAYRQQLLISYFSEFSNRFDLISLINRDHTEEVKIVRGKQSESLSKFADDPDYLKSLKKSNTMFISGIELIPELQEYGIQLYFPYSDFFDEQLGTFRFVVSLSRLTTILNQLGFASFSRVFIISDDGKLVYTQQKHDNEVLVTDASHPFFPLYRLINQGRKSFQKISFLERSFTFYLAEYPRVNWTICVGADRDAMEKPIKDLRDLLAVICFLIVLGGELLSRIVGFRITEPISRLNKTALAIIHSGRVSDRVEWQSMDEIGELAQSFNLMLDRLGKARSQILEEKNFIEQVFSSMIDGMATISMEGQITSVNRALVNLLGYERNELIDQPFSVFFPGNGMSITGKEKIDLVEYSFLKGKEIEILAKSGEEISVSFSCVIVTDNDSQPKGMLFLFKDMREEKLLREKQEEAENKLRNTQAELLKTEKIAVVGEMAGMVAHEVLNPVSAANVRIDICLKNAEELTKVIEVLVKIIDDWQEQIRNNTFADYFTKGGSRDLSLLQKISETLRKRQSDRLEDFQFLQRQVMKIIKIIEGLREMSRRERTIEKINLAGLVEDVLSDMQDGIRKRDIEVEKNIVFRPEIMADYMEVYSIFSNILKNAMQAIEMKSGGERKISLVLDMADSSHARIAVTDSGIGMDAVARETIFTPGYTSKGRKGTGIGSGFSRKLARQYGGDITVAETEPGVGTTIHIVLALTGEER